MLGRPSSFAASCSLLKGGAALAGVGCAAGLASGQVSAKRYQNPISVSTYSYWRYRRDTKLSIAECIDLASEAGFDGLEILHIQMEKESNGHLQSLKQHAFRNGLDLCGFSTHQSFVSPDPDFRKPSH